MISELRHWYQISSLSRACGRGPPCLHSIYLLHFPSCSRRLPPRQPCLQPSPTLRVRPLVALTASVFTQRHDSAHNFPVLSPPVRACAASGHPTSPSAAAAGKSKDQTDGGIREGAAGIPTTAYEVYCVPSLAPMIEQSRMTSLERRLALVEGKMGIHKMSLLPHADLFGAVNEMQQRIKLLDPQKIESLQKRVQVGRVLNH